MTIMPGVPGVIDKLDTLKLALDGIKEIGKIIFTMAKVLGVLKQDMDMQDIGNKAIQAEAVGITSDKFDTYEAYLVEVEKFEVDPEKTANISPELTEIKGVEIAVCLMVEKLMDLPIVTIVESIISDPLYFEGGKIEKICELINKNGQFASDFVSYISGEERDIEKLERITNILVDVEKDFNPSISDKDAYKKVMDLRR